MHILLLLQIVSVFSSLEKMTTGGKKKKKNSAAAMACYSGFLFFFVSFFSVNFSIKKITLNFVLKIHVCGMGLAIGKIL